MINVLFVSREKGKGQVGSIIKAQGESLKNDAVVSYYSISGKGSVTYIKHIPKIRRYAKQHKIDVIHAHYSFSAYTAALAFSAPVICSLMGSDIQVKGIKRILIKAFSLFFWKSVIVKSRRMKEKINIKNAIVIPNGVNRDIFNEIPPLRAFNEINLESDKKYILFLANPARLEKNFQLALKSFNLLEQKSDIELIPIYNVPHKEIPYYLSASMVLLLTSIWEGSPNVIKEAMACNCPIVSTDVGDVREVIGETEGCYLTSFEAEDVAEKLKMALDFGKRTNGREKIQHLDDRVIAERLIEVYRSVLK